MVESLLLHANMLKLEIDENHELFTEFTETVNSGVLREFSRVLHFCAEIHKFSDVK